MASKWNRLDSKAHSQNLVAENFLPSFRKYNFAKSSHTWLWQCQWVHPFRRAIWQCILKVLKMFLHLKDFHDWSCAKEMIISMCKDLTLRKFCCAVLSCVRLFVTPWTVACQGLLSMEFSRQEYWRGLPFPTFRGSSWFRDQTGFSWVSCIGHRATWDIEEVQSNNFQNMKNLKQAPCPTERNWLN